MTRLSTCRVALLCAFAIVAGQALEAQTPAVAEPPLAEQIEQVFVDAYPDDKAPGAAMIVVVDGQVVYRGARGMAHVELDVPLSPDNVFRLGSITKQFTGAAILLLEEEGKLAVSDSISKYLPDYPTHGRTITIEHLLTHTSGIFDATDIPQYMSSDVRLDRSTQELLELFQDLELEFAPGERWDYSNSGYLLLGAIIEAVSGQSYAEFVRQRIFAPLGLERTDYGGHQIIPGRVAGYTATESGFVNAEYISMTQPHAAGALVSTVDDLAAWDAALAGGELISPESYRRMTTPYVLDGGEATGYGYGYSLSTLRGRPVVQHGGGIHGFTTFGLRIPEEDIYVAVLSNYPGGGLGPGPLALKVGALVLGDPFPEYERIELAPEILERYVGVYRIDETTRRTVTLEDGKLYTQRSGGPRLEAIPYAERGFFYRGMTTHFELVLDDDGGVSHMLMYHDGVDTPERADYTDEPVVVRTEVALDPATYERYVGDYELAPGFVLTITRQDDGLFAQATGQPRVEVFPSGEAEFFYKVVDAQLSFELGPDGRAAAVTLHQAGQHVRGRRMGE